MKRVKVRFVVLTGSSPCVLAFFFFFFSKKLTTVVAFYCRSAEACDRTASFPRRYHQRTGENQEYVDYSTQD